MVKWRIYYDDGSTYSCLDGSWEDAPEHGVLCVVVRDPTGQWGRWVVSGWSVKRGEKPGGNDFFVKDFDSEEPHSTYDITPFLAKPGNTEVMVKFGRMTSTENWQATMNRAGKDPDFPKGSPRRRSSDWR